MKVDRKRRFSLRKDSRNVSFALSLSEHGIRIDLDFNNFLSIEFRSEIGAIACLLVKLDVQFLLLVSLLAQKDGEK
jgi:hypothetical protein